MRCLLIFMLMILSCLGSACKSRTFDSDFRDAESRMGLGHTEDALESYINISKRYHDDPRRPAVLLKIAKLFETDRHDLRTAIDAYGRIIDQYPLTASSRTAREERAKLEQRRGNFDAAIEDLSALLKLFPDSEDHLRYRVLIGGVYLTSGQYSQARAELSPLLLDETVSADILEQALFTYAESFFLEGRSEDARKWYRVFIRNFPDSDLSDEVKLHLATCLEELGRLGAAREVTMSAHGYPNKDVIDVRLNSIDERGTEPPDKTASDALKGKPEGEMEEH